MRTGAFAGEMRPVYDVLTAFGFYRLGVASLEGLRRNAAEKDRDVAASVVNDAIADVDDAVDAADGALAQIAVICDTAASRDSPRAHSRTGRINSGRYTSTVVQVT